MPFLSCKEALSHPVSLSYNRNFSEVAFFVPLGNVLSPQFSFEKFLANTRLNILRVKGQCKLHFSLLSVFHCCVWLLNFTPLPVCSSVSALSFSSLLDLLELLLHSCSSLPLSLSLSALCHSSISFNLLSVTLHIWPSLYLDRQYFSNGKELQFVFLCFPVFSTPLWQRSAWLFGVCVLSSLLNALTKALMVLFGLYVLLISVLFSLLVECDSLLWQNPKH